MDISDTIVVFVNLFRLALYALADTVLLAPRSDALVLIMLLCLCRGDEHLGGGAGGHERAHDGSLHRAP